jgi:molybdenum cofactor cytidylyltransferase
MEFGPIPLAQAEGAIAAHSLRFGSGVVKKGTILTAELLARLAAEGITEVVAARLAPGDVGEDEAARAVAAILAGPGIRLDEAGTGRCNLYAERAGLFVVSRAAMLALNRIDPGLTVATLAEYAAVEAGRMVATVKVIPFALARSVLDAAVQRAADAALAVAVWRPLKIGLAATILPGLKTSTMDKTRRVLEERLRPTGAAIVGEARVPHAAPALAEALSMLHGEGADLLVAFGASAVTDRADVIPAAIEQAGGRVTQIGMPVDPGNLLVLGELGGRPVIGAPGCARSSAENGFDWVLQRLLAGVDVPADAIAEMGVGGLLMDIVSRPQPRETAAAADATIAAIVLAAGQSRRMGGPNKLLARFGREPLIRRTVQNVVASGASPVIVVTGHMAHEIGAALEGIEVELVHNPDFAEGLASSLKTGLGKVPAAAAGALVVLADMPGITTDILRRLISTFQARPRPAIVLPTVAGKRGNPVLWSRDFFPELMAVSGDTGARHVLARHEDAVERVEIGQAAGLDVDTPAALKAAGGTFAEAS